MSNDNLVQSTLDQLRPLIDQYFQASKGDNHSGPWSISLSTPTFGADEVMEVLDSLLSTEVTMGRKVKEFEERFAEYIGVRHAIMVNSGSSANLLALTMLTDPQLEGRIKPGDEIITPAVTWASTVYPIIQVGAIPVLVDVELETVNMGLAQLEAALTPLTRGIMLVHLLGKPCPMDTIMEFARAHNLFVIEDCCEAHGAEFGNRRVGSFGHLGTYSFYFSHHITTIEGGMIVTNDDDLAESARALRAFGWVRDLKNRQTLALENPKIDDRFLFVSLGFNVRPTEIQGAFGMHQLGKLEGFIEARQANARYWTERLRPFEKYFLLPVEQEGARHAWLFYPLIVRPDAPFTRSEVVQFLESKGVETRPVMAGNMAEQPVMRHFAYRSDGALTNARFIMRNGLLFGTHHGIGPQEREALVDYIKEFVAIHTASRK